MYYCVDYLYVDVANIILIEMHRHTDKKKRVPLFSSSLYVYAEQLCEFTG